MLLFNHNFYKLGQSLSGRVCADFSKLQCLHEWLSILNLLYKNNKQTTETEQILADCECMR